MFSQFTLFILHVYIVKYTPVYFWMKLYKIQLSLRPEDSFKLNIYNEYYDYIELLLDFI